MNLKEKRYSHYALVEEMIQTVHLVKNFNPSCADSFLAYIQNTGGLLLTGEGSSRIFPAKHAIYHAKKKGLLRPIITEGATQALEYPLDLYAVIGASNSGKTKELVHLFTKLRNEKHAAILGVTADPESAISRLAHETHVLSCGKEKAVAATKSVIEQALFFDTLIKKCSGSPAGNLVTAAEDIASALTMPIDASIIAKLEKAKTVFFCGRNNGVAEELTLKANEITRKRSDFLEGTYAVHGIEEVLTPDDIVVIIDPFESEEEKFYECLEQRIGVNIIALASRKTRFTTVPIPKNNDFQNYIELAAGWNLLVETGLSLAIDLDNPVRARKVGNEFLI